jgi:hypothetical protein
MLRAWRCSEVPVSVGLKFLRALICREIGYTGVGCRMSFDEPGRWSARKYLCSKKVSTASCENQKHVLAPCPIASVVGRARKFDSVRFSRKSTRALHKFFPFILFPYVDVKGGAFVRYETRKAGCATDNNADKRRSGHALKMATHTPRTGPTCASGRVDSSIERESDSFTSDRARFRFLDEGDVDMI